MRNVTKYYVFGALLAFFTLNVAAQDAETALDSNESSVRTAFIASVESYVKLHRTVESGMPKVPTDATSEQIAAHKAALLVNVKAARKLSKKGEIFTPAATEMIAKIIKANYSDEELANLKIENSEADTKGVQLKVNSAYPEGREKIEMPPRLLLALPKLPEEVNYRFVGKHLLLVDKESGLILDFMSNALP